MENRYIANYDIKQKCITYIKFKQGDVDSAVLEVHLTDNGEVIDITGETIEFRFSKPDNTVVYQDSSTGVTILDETGGKIECVLKSNTLAKPGNVKCEIHRAKDGKELTTSSFYFIVESSIGESGVLSTNYIKLIDDKVTGWQTKIDSMQTEYNGLKQIILDTNQAADLQDQINQHTTELNEKTKQLELTGWELQNKTRKVKPIVTFISDDGNKKDYENLKPIAVSKGVPFVSAIVTNAIGNTTQMTLAQLLELQSLGWEMSSHTHTHTTLTTLTYDQIDIEMKTSKETLEGLGIKCSTLCIPYGIYNDNVLEISRKYFRGARSSDGGINTPPLKTFRTVSVLYAEDSVIDAVSGFARNSLEYYKLKVDNAVAQNGWLQFLMHSNNVDATQLGYLGQLIDYIQSLNIDIVTLDEGFDIYGNIIDIGNYDTNDLSKKHYVVGANGTMSKTRSDDKIFITNTNEYSNASLPSDFVKGFITYTKVSLSSATGMPESKAGTLITDNIQTDAGWSYQEYHVIGSANIYKRYSLSNNTWSTWSQTNVSPTNVNGAVTYKGTDAYLSTILPNGFPVGNITISTVTNGNATGFPESKGGRLITDRLVTETAWEYQEYHVLGSLNIYKRYAVSDTVWSAWSLLSNTVIQATDTILGSTLATSITKGKIIYNTIITASATDMPEAKGGLLETLFASGSNGYSYQIYHIYNSWNTYKRYLTDTGAWSTWKQYTLV